MGAGPLRRAIFNPGEHAPSTSLGLLILRLGAGAMLLAGHGWSKVLAYSAHSGGFPDPLGIGNAQSMAATIGAEVVCAALVGVGLLTRLAALPVAFTMAIAAFVVNAGGSWGDKELAVIYLVPFAALLFTGPGAISLDARIGREGGRRR